MSQTVTGSPSRTFLGAQKLSRIMAWVFTIAFWVMVFVLLANTESAIFPIPNRGIGLEHGIRIPTGSLHGWQAVWALVGAFLVLVPDVMILHHTRKLFFCFARGEVFATKPIAHIRATGMWLTLSFFTGIAAIYILNQIGLKNAFFPVHFSLPGSLPFLILEFKGTLFTGIATTIAAYVMEEARRIAADNAEIV